MKIQARTIRTIQDLLNKEIDKCKEVLKLGYDEEVVYRQSDLEIALEEFTLSFAQGDR